MARLPNDAKVLYARTFGAIKAVEDVTLLDPDRAAQARFDWPELWDKLDAAFAVLRE